MVKVWYEPPPYGPGSSLNRPSYGHQAGGSQLIQQLSRRPQGLLIAGACVGMAALAYIPISEYYSWKWLLEFWHEASMLIVFRNYVPHCTDELEGGD